MKYKILGLGIIVFLITISFSSTVSACWTYETAWGGCQDFEGKSTARYIEYDFTYCGENHVCKPLLVGKPGHFTWVGFVKVWHESNCGELLCIKFVTFYGWRLFETHVHVDDGSDPIPVNRGGNPQVGLFEYSYTPYCPWWQIYCCEIPSSGFEGVTFEIAAHAVVGRAIY